MALKTIAFDIVAELDSEAAVHEYLSQVFADGDNDEIMRALGHVARARGVVQLTPRPNPSEH